MSTSLVADGATAPPAVLKQRRLSRPALLFIPSLLVLTAVIYFAFGYWTVGRFIESTDDAYVGGNVTDLAPKVSGLIAEVAVKDNQMVHAGDLLVKIDDREFLVAV